MSFLFAFVLYVSGKLYLYRALHGVLPLGKHQIHSICQWEGVVAEYVGESNHFPAASLGAVTYHLVVGIVCGGHQAQCVGILEILHVGTGEVETVVDFEVAVHFVEIQAVEFALCVAQRQVECRCLQYLVGMARREPESAPSVYDIFAKTYSHLGHTLLGKLVVERVIVQ